MGNWGTEVFTCMLSPSHKLMGPSAVRENKHTPVSESIFSFMRVGGLGMGKIIWKEGSFYLLISQTCS